MSSRPKKYFVFEVDEIILYTVPNQLILSPPYTGPVPYYRKVPTPYSNFFAPAGNIVGQGVIQKILEANTKLLISI